MILSEIKVTAQWLVSMQTDSLHTKDNCFRSVRANLVNYSETVITVTHQTLDQFIIIKQCYLEIIYIFQNLF